MNIFRLHLVHPSIFSTEQGVLIPEQGVLILCRMEKMDGGLCVREIQDAAGRKRRNVWGGQRGVWQMHGARGVWGAGGTSLILIM